ncbi:MAG: hypothetical protein ABUK08_00290 [Candidatus Humimicrobiaceae bacterium]
MTVLKMTLSDAETFDIRNLLKKSELKNNKVLILTALGLLNWCIDEIDKGKSISSVDKENNTFTEIKLFENKVKDAVKNKDTDTLNKG